MGALCGLLLGLGLLLIWRSGSRAPQSHRTGPSWRERRTDQLRQAGFGAVSPVQFILLQAVTALIVGVAVLVITRTVTVAACFAAFGGLGPEVMVRRLRDRRQTMLRELWPEAVDNLASAVRAGMSLPEGLSALAQRGPELLRPPFARFGASYRVSGRFNDCLNALKDDLADPVGDRVCETLRVAREVGGTDLGVVLRTLSELLRSDGRTRSELETRQGWIVNAARLAVAAPWIVLLLLGTEASTLQTFDSAGGSLLLIIGLAVCVVAYRMMLRIGKLPEEQRVLR